MHPARQATLDQYFKLQQATLITAGLPPEQQTDTIRMSVSVVLTVAVTGQIGAERPTIGPAQMIHFDEDGFLTPHEESA